MAFPQIDGKAPGYFGLLRRYSLASQLTLLVLIAALPLATSAYFIYQQLAANQRDNLQQNLILRAKALAALIDNEIDTHKAVASTLALSIELQTDNLVAFYEQAKRAVALVPGSWISLSGPDAQVLLTTLTPLGQALPRHLDPAMVARGFSEKTPQISELVFGPTSRQWTAYIETPVFRGDTPVYSISIALPPSRFLAFLEANVAGDNAIAVLDRMNRFVARVPDHATRVGGLASEGLRAAIAKNPDGGWVEARTVEGDLSLQGYSQSAYGWFVGIARTETSIALPLAPIFYRSLAINSGLILLSLLAAFFLARSMSRGMALLAQAAQQVGDGKTFAAPPTSFREADAIGSTLASVSDKLRRQNAEIAQHQNELEIAVKERTAELTAEIKRRTASENTLRQVQKMDAIGQLTGGIAHDFNNMLTIILGNLDSLQRRLKPGVNVETLVRPLEFAQQGARNAAKLTHRLLAFSRQQPLDPSVVHLNKIVGGMSDMLSRLVGETIKIETVAGAGLWTAFADTNQIENALVNLVSNARDAMPAGGKITVETSNSYLDENYVSRFGSIEPGQYVMLCVSDTGTGIAPETLERVFEPFFTSKEPGKGTGLGLAMVHGFVAQSGGHIRIYSEVGEGTSVRIYLPRKLADPSVGLPAASDEVIENTPVARTGETVFIVEDQPGVRAYAIEVLEDLGYKVHVAESGPDALSQAANLHFDLLFTDVVLPDGMNGREVASALQKLKPDPFIVLFTTGYTRNAIVHEGRLDSGVNLIQKPYTQRELAVKIRALLDARRSR